MENFYEHAKGTFIDNYYEKLDFKRKAADFFRSLLIALLDEFEIQTISSRVKTIQSSLEKFDRKYRKEVEKLNQSYEIEPHLTD